MPTQPSGPPTPALSLRVGVSGHRRLEGHAAASIEEALGTILGSLRDQYRAMSDEFRAVYADQPQQLSLTSQLAAGVDQIAAAHAREAGYELRTVLPFSKEQFTRDFSPEDRKQFEALLNDSQCWSLPGMREEEDIAYALAGEATVAQCDLLIAVWDGGPARGIGGTADVIDYAVRRGVPVIHIPAGDASNPVILWSGFEKLPPALFHRHDVPRRPLTPEILSQILRAVLLPAQEYPLLSSYVREHQRRWRFRLEYPVLLALTGIRRMSGKELRASRYEERVAEDWKAWRSDAIPPVAGMDQLERAFAWADGLADHFAQLYRSGFIFNFVAAALAIIAGLTGFLWPEGKIILASTELVLVSGLIINTAIGTRCQWHRRWLDYRFLAEQLRPMRSLALLSLCSPRAGSGNVSWDDRWVHWYASAMWRSLGPPPSISTTEQVQRLAEHVAKRELDDQIAYHQLNSKRMHRLDHRLHRIGALLFYMTGAIALTLLCILLLKLDVMQPYMKPLSVLSIALPTIGSAIFGIRGVGDFAAAASRSAQTAARLEQIAARLRRNPLYLSEAARAIEEAAAVMQRDLGEWHSAFRFRILAIPS